MIVQKDEKPHFGFRGLDCVLTLVMMFQVYTGKSKTLQKQDHHWFAKDNKPEENFPKQSCISGGGGSGR